MRAGNSDTAGSMTTDGDAELMRKSESDGKASPPPVVLLICSSDY
jgi:hypothetical protein